MNRTLMAEWRRIAPQVWDMFDLTTESRQSAVQAAAGDSRKALRIYQALISDSKIPSTLWKDTNLMKWFVTKLT